MSKTLTERAYKLLRNKLETGELAPGTQLVNRALGKELGLSTGTIRGAIHRLASEGLVEHIPNAGAYVRKLNRSDITELYKVRTALDMFVIDEAFAKIDDEQLERLKHICSDFQALAKSIRQHPKQTLDGEGHRRWIALDMEFHRILVEATGNKLLKKILADFHVMAQVGYNMPPEFTLRSAAKTYRMHCGIYHGLRDRDLAQSRYWMNIHNTVGLVDIRRLTTDD
jgi:DNA-binding GntR family transcriptional regulator